ncbi:MAG: helix-turn-helix domain-containing protein [Patescibacteria group bacterium]|nr:helix-turn-helix domain-containing protein [Patescibacteria group bacterium]
MKLLPPLPQKSTLSRLSPIINYANQGLSVKVFGLPGVGKTSVFSWLANTPSLQQSLKVLPNTQILYLDLEPTITTLGHKSLVQQAQQSLSRLKENKQNRLVFILDSAIVLKQNQVLQTIFSQGYQSFRPRLSFVYLLTNFHQNYDLIKQIPLLKTSLGEAILFFPLFNQEESNHAIDQWQQITGFNFFPAQRNLILSQSGGYAVLIKKLALLLKENPEIIPENQILKQFPEVVDVLNRLYPFFSDHQKQILSLLANKKTRTMKKDSFDLNVLKNFGVLNAKKDLFSPLFTRYLILQNRFRSNTNGFAFTDNLTASELNLFNLLYQNQNQIVDRDAIAQAIWGNLWQEKYSDWAIDKIISQLRHKMAKKEDRRKLTTFRGRGFCLSILAA